MGAVSVFTNGELHPSTTVKAAFRDISTTRFTLMGDSPGHSRESEAYNPEERQNPNLSLVQTPHNLDSSIPKEIRISLMLSIIVVPQRGKDPESCSLERVCCVRFRNEYSSLLYLIQAQSSSIFLKWRTSLITSIYILLLSTGS